MFGFPFLFFPHKISSPHKLNSPKKKPNKITPNIKTPNQTPF